MLGRCRHERFLNEASGRLRGNVRTSSIARWKPMYDFLFVITELFSLAFAVEALQGKTCPNSLFLEGVGHFDPRFQGEGVLPREHFSL